MGQHGIDTHGGQQSCRRGHIHLRRLSIHTEDPVELFCHHKLHKDASDGLLTSLPHAHGTHRRALALGGLGDTLSVC